MTEVEGFIRERQLDVATRALAALTEAESTRLAAETHRLKGVLSSYQLTTASAAVNRLDQALRGHAQESEVQEELSRALAALTMEVQQLTNRGQ